LKTTLGEKHFSQSTALPTTTVNMTMTTDFSKHWETASLPEGIIMSETPFGNPDLQLQKKEF
jgi:hypothetical protein